MINELNNQVSFKRLILELSELCKIIARLAIKKLQKIDATDIIVFEKPLISVAQFEIKFSLIHI